MDHDRRPGDDFRRSWKGLIVGLLICVPVWLLLGYAVAGSVH